MGVIINGLSLATNNMPENRLFRVHAGVFDAFFEEGSLRYLSVGKTEILRMVYFALRDKEWLNVTQRISDLNILTSDDSFKISFNSIFETEGISFHASFIYEGKNDSSIIFSFEGKALKSFRKNRIGFCVLHPLKNYTGIKCKILHPEGIVESAEFPELISPHQLFSDVVQMEWQIDGNDYSLRFEGDLFETEDQRNWTDSSFKTYSTPLRFNFPSTIKEGDFVRQKIELGAKVNFPVTAPDEEEHLLIKTETDSLISLPLIGIAHSTRCKSLTDNEINILKKVAFDHYRIEIHLSHQNWKEKAEIEIQDPAGLDIPLEIALFFSEKSANEASGFANWVKRFYEKIVLIIIYSSNEKSTPKLLASELTGIIKTTLPGILTGIGTNSNFAELNRNRPDAGLYDFLCYSIHPQEHASDNFTLVENLEAQSHTITTAKGFAIGKGIRVSTVNIQRRFNSNINNFEIPFEGSILPPQVDSRLMSLFGASWCLGSVKYLSEAGASGLTFLETAGERGIIQGDFPSRWPDSFGSFTGMIFPVYHVFRFIMKNKKNRIQRSYSNSPLLVNSLVLDGGDKLNIVVVNHSAKNQIVDIKIPDNNYSVRRINTGSYDDSIHDPEWLGNSSAKQWHSSDPFYMKPYEIAFIEGKKGR